MDKGDSIMNIGISFVRRKKYKKAIGYFRKSLDFCEDDFIKSALFNNLAETYMHLKDYDKALYYVNLAFHCVDNENLSDLFICCQTHVQILMNKGDFNEAIDRLVELVNKAEDKFVYKKFIIDGISTIIEYGWTMQNMDILKKLDELIYKLIKSSNSQNKEYIQELKSCLGDIRFCVKDSEKSFY